MSINNYFPIKKSGSVDLTRADFGMPLEPGCTWVLVGPEHVRAVPLGGSIPIIDRLTARYRQVFVVDSSPQSISVSLTLPSQDEHLTFDAVAQCVLTVRDPCRIVREGVSEVLPLVTSMLYQAVGQVTRKFDVMDAGQAEAEINAQIAALMKNPDRSRYPLFRAFDVTSLLVRIVVSEALSESVRKRAEARQAQASERLRHEHNLELARLRAIREREEAEAARLANEALRSAQSQSLRIEMQDLESVIPDPLERLAVVRGEITVAELIERREAERQQLREMQTRIMQTIVEEGVRRDGLDALEATTGVTGDALFRSLIAPTSERNTSTHRPRPLTEGTEGVDHEHTIDPPSTSPAL